VQFQLPDDYYLKDASQGYYAILFGGNTLQDNIYQYISNLQDGIVVIIDDPERFPIRSEGIFVASGFQANIALSKTIRENLPYPYSDCQEADSVDTLLSREMKRLGYAYTRDNCMILCEQKQNINMRGCYDVRLPAILNARPCLTLDDYTAMNIPFFNYTECFNYCPFECKTITYTTSISYAAYPTVNYCRDNDTLSFLNSVYLTNFSSSEYFKDRMASVVIKFKKFTYTEVVDSPVMYVGDLISNIGGTLGLFVGISVLSFVEIIELIINIIFIYYNKWKNEKTSNAKNLSSA
jgi:hypothetical protein